MDSTPPQRSFLRRLSAGELPLGTSCAYGLFVVLFWTAALTGLGVFLAPRSLGFLHQSLGTWGSFCAFSLFLGAMAASTHLVSRGIARSAKRFPGRPSYALLARLFSFLMFPILIYQALFLLLAFSFGFILLALILGAVIFFVAL